MAILMLTKLVKKKAVSERKRNIPINYALDWFFLAIIYFLAKVTSVACINIQRGTDKINDRIFLWKAELLKVFREAEGVGSAC